MPPRAFPFVFLILLLAAPDLAAQPSVKQTLPVENVTVTSLKDAPRQVVDQFVQSFAAPSYLAGKIGRWGDGVCPSTVGLGKKFADFVTTRVREIAAKTGAPVNKDRACRANIEIIFTTDPQALLKEVRKHHKEYLSYFSGSGQADELAIVRRPIQAWYMTATKDADGDVEVDNLETIPLQPVTNLQTDLLGGGTGKGHAGVRAVTGGRLSDGLQTVFRHVLIVADPARLTDYEVGTLADYIAMLSLTQLNSLDVCQPLPSIINLLAHSCPTQPGQLSESDLAYLHGLYAMRADGDLRVQEDGIAYQMQHSPPAH